MRWGGTRERAQKKRKLQGMDSMERSKNENERRKNKRKERRDRIGIEIERKVQ
jgi:hypothetical protein